MPWRADGCAGVGTSFNSHRSLRQDQDTGDRSRRAGLLTYLGGSLTDAATSIAVDSSGDAYITGFTASTNFPVTSDVYQPQCNGCTTTGTNNAFITELDPTGSILVYSTYLGGNNGDSGMESPSMRLATLTL